MSPTYVEPILRDRLRGLRLWHWQMAMKHRKAENELTELKLRHGGSSLKSCIKTYADAANLHLTAVQTLNEFFEIGDTAEQDDSK
jgi:hypothetical protein